MRLEAEGWQLPRGRIYSEQEEDAKQTLSHSLLAKEGSA